MSDVQTKTSKELGLTAKSDGAVHVAHSKEPLAVHYDLGGNAYVSHDGGDTRVARFIYESFNGPLPKGHGVVHADGNKANCALDNLEAASNY